MTKASPITTEGTRLCQCVHGAPSTGIWSLATADAGTNRGYRKVRGARAGRLRSKNLVRRRSRQQHDAAREPLGKDRLEILPEMGAIYNISEKNGLEDWAINV